MTTFAIGVDLGGTNLRIAAVDSNGKTLEKISTSTEVSRGRNLVIDEMCTAIQQTVTKLHGAGELAGIGIGVPGIIEMQTGMVRASPNLPGWHDYPVRDEIERRLGTTVVLENDANAAALGEKWLGAGATVEEMCMLTLGTGVGGGVVLNGRVWHGMTGMAGELGHINVEPEGPPCNCGSRGCLEQLASATAVKRMAVEAVATGKASELARAMDEDPEFSSKVVNIFNLPMYVVGGGVASAWDAFAPAMLETIRRNSFVYRATAPAENTRGVEGSNVPDDVLPARRTTIITRALLGSDAGLIGAARLPMIAGKIASAEAELKRA